MTFFNQIKKSDPWNQTGYTVWNPEGGDWGWAEGENVSFELAKHVLLDNGFCHKRTPWGEDRFETTSKKPPSTNHTNFTNTPTTNVSFQGVVALSNQEFAAEDATTIGRVPGYYLNGYGNGAMVVHRLQGHTGQGGPPPETQNTCDGTRANGKGYQGDDGDQNRRRNIAGIYGVAWAAPPGCRPNDVQLINYNKSIPGWTLPTMYVHIGWSIEGKIIKSWESFEVLAGYLHNNRLGTDRHKEFRQEAARLCYEAAIEAKKRLHAALLRANSKDAVGTKTGTYNTEPTSE